MREPGKYTPLQYHTISATLTIVGGTTNPVLGGREEVGEKKVLGERTGGVKNK